MLLLSQNAWQYFLTVPGSEGGVVTSVTVVILSPSFHPEKWQALLEAFSKSYLESGSPVALLTAFLGAFTTKQVPGKWKASEFNDQQVSHEFGGARADEHASLSGVNPAHRLQNVTPARSCHRLCLSLLLLLLLVWQAVLGGRLGEVLGAFGVHAVLIWTAMLLKKRVVVVGDSSEQVLATVRVLPQFVWSRQNWALLRPLVTPSEAELADLEAAGVYVAGFLEDSGAKGWPGLWDLLVDAGAREVRGGLVNRDTPCSAGAM